MASKFGSLFRVSTFGESHGVGVGVVVDGCPAGLPLDEETIQRELDRRRPGQSRITTQRKEGDRVEILSGVHEGRTLGTPIAMLVRNEDQRSKDYDEMREKYRPSHADFAYDQKYGMRGADGRRAGVGARDHRAGGGGRAGSPVPGDAGGGDRRVGLDGGRPGSKVDADAVTVEDVDANIVRCPDPACRRADARADRGGAQGRRLHRRDDGVRRAGRPGGLGRAGVRQAGGRPRPRRC